MDVLDAGCMDRSSCDWFLNDLGPPPDAILRIPPPPVPHFIDSDYVVAAGMALTDDSTDNDTLCHWCHWARLADSSSITGSSGAGNDCWDLQSTRTPSHDGWLSTSQLTGVCVNLHCGGINEYRLNCLILFVMQRWRWKIRGSSSFWLRV